MAIANGTCVSFCNQPKSHFALLSVCPWDNCGECHMDEKRIQCLSNTSPHVPIYLQPFPSNSTRKFAILAIFLHILASPGYAPGTIVVNLHGRKEDSMLVKPICSGQAISKADIASAQKTKKGRRTWQCQQECGHEHQMSQDQLHTQAIIPPVTTDWLVLLCVVHHCLSPVSDK